MTPCIELVLEAIFPLFLAGAILISAVEYWFSRDLKRTLLFLIGLRWPASHHTLGASLFVSIALMAYVVDFVDRCTV